MTVTVDAPQRIAGKARWVLDTLLAACAEPVDVAYPSTSLPGDQAAWAFLDGGEPQFGDDLVAAAFWHLSRWEERPGSARDRHGRFAAAFSTADPESPAVDALLRRFQEACGAERRPGFRVVLSHDIDEPWHWHGRAAVRASTWRLKQAVRERRPADVKAEATGLAGMPYHLVRGSDPMWTFDQMREIEGRHGGRSTHFLIGGHAHPADGPAQPYERLLGRIARTIIAGGDEVGLHPSYTASGDPTRIAGERQRVEDAAGRAVTSVRFHFLRHETHRDLRLLDGLGFRVDSTQGYGDQPGLRAGFSHPYHPYDLDGDRRLGLLEVPLAVMDATLQDVRYLGLSADEGLRRATAVLELVAQSGGTAAVLWHNSRFAPAYGRGWDRVYDRLLAWVRSRGGELVACEDVS